MVYLRAILYTTIQEVYNEHVLHMLSQQEDSKLYFPGPPMLPTHTEMEHLTKLKKRVHQLEVESRVLLRENDRLAIKAFSLSPPNIHTYTHIHHCRLKKELDEEVLFHKEELDRIHEEGKAAIADVLAQPLPPKDYAGRVEELQEEVTDISVLTALT